MSQPYEPSSSRLSGVDPFRAYAPEQPTEENLEAAWFDAPPSSRRLSVRPSAPPSAPPPSIGDRDADAWFR